MKSVHLVRPLQELISGLQREGSRIALVPTMGNLHQGHLDLVTRAQSLGSSYKIISTIFVNPLQFVETAGNDFTKYPRTLADDTEKLERAGCHILFAPETPEEIYPKYPVDTQIHVGGIGKILEGEFRPGFFDGVATVILILLHLCKPSVVIMGEKDWQQLQVVKQVVRDLHLDVEVLGVPTRREDTGLAMSSRNVFLTPEAKIHASLIYRTLKNVEMKLKLGNQDFEAMEEMGKQELTSSGFHVQYLTIRNPNLSFPNAANIGNECVVLVAAVLNSTRLIDNLVVSLF